MSRSFRVVAFRTATLVVAPMLTAVMLTSTPAHAAVLATTLVSAPDGSTDGTANDNYSALASVSADGRYVAFESASNNLSDDDNNNYVNVFVRDVQTNATTLVSAPTGSTDGTGNNDDSIQASISADGRYVAFASGSDNLSASDNNDHFNIFVRDMTTNTTTLVSAPTGSTDGTGNNEASFLSSISDDGRYVGLRLGRR